MIESMAAGLPIIVTNNRGSRELISDNGFLIDFSVDELAKSVEFLYENKNEYKKMSVASKLKSNEFSKKNIDARMREIYE